MTVWNRPALATLCAVALWGGCTAQLEPDYVARVGDVVITFDEYENRARRLLRTGYQGTGRLDEATRLSLLDDIVVQKLLLVEGRARGLHKDSLIADEIGRVEQKALIETLYTRQAEHPPYTFSDEEIGAVYHRGGYDSEVRTQQIVCVTKAEATQALGQVQAGADFATLVARYSPEFIQRRFGRTGDIGWFSMADMLAELKPALVSMEVGELLPEPVASRLGHHVLRLTGRQGVPLDSVRARVVKDMRRAAVNADRLGYIQQLRHRYDMRLYPEALAALHALPADRKTWDEGDMELYTWTGGSLTIRDYLAMHRLGRVRHPASQDSAGLRRLTDNLAGQEIMKAEARSLGYDREPNVRAAVARKENELIAKALFEAEGKARAETVTDQDVRQYYQSHPELFTTEDGKVSELDLVGRSISRQLIQRAENEAMDRFIQTLRERYADRIELRADRLEEALADLQG